MTLFLRVPAVPLDNNITEQALKKVILHRKNALFYKTLNGARVGDIFMSLIYTAELNRIDPFDYLVALQRHAEELAAQPADWMPWNYPMRIPAKLNARSDDVDRAVRGAQSLAEVFNIVCVFDREERYPRGRARGACHAHEHAARWITWRSSKGGAVICVRLSPASSFAATRRARRCDGCDARGGRGSHRRGWVRRDTRAIGLRGAGWR